MHPDDRESVLANWRQAVLGGQKCGQDFRLLKPDGQISWVNGSLVPLRNGQGEITGYLGNNLDITLRKRDDEWKRTRATVMDELARGASLQAMMHFIATEAERQVAGMSCSILLVDESGRLLIRNATPSLPLPAGGQSLSCCSEPIHAMNGKVLGVLSCYRHLPGNAEAGDIELVHKAVHLAGLVIEHKHTENELQIAASVYQPLRLPMLTIASSPSIRPLRN